MIGYPLSYYNNCIMYGVEAKLLQVIVMKSILTAHMFEPICFNNMLVNNLINRIPPKPNILAEYVKHVKTQ